MYSQSSTTDTYNYLLNGRWHSGTTPDTMGQLEIEHYIIDKSNMTSKSNVLDFGCGNGVTTCDYSILTGATVHGTTNEPSQIRNAQKLARKLQLKVNFELCSNILPYKDNMFDIIVFTESLCHIENKAAIFNEFKRVLAPDGIVCGEDWTHLVPLNESAQAINRAYHTHMVSPRKYQDLIFKAGMKSKIVDIIKPEWDQSLMSSVSNQLRLSYYQFVYPLLRLSCPYKVNTNNIDFDLIKAGKFIEQDPDFRLIILCFTLKAE
jgi:cyclopropane fatty-acyl-phospholipid synthase-like methyltransferase